MKECECGCGSPIPLLASDGRPRRFLQGHQNKGRRRAPAMKPCECGCGGMLPEFDGKGRPRRFIKGHHAGQPGSVNALRQYRGNRRGVTPWNKGRSYVFAKMTEYANRSSWMKAMRRLFPDACMRCGWAEGPCDTHHIVPRSDGGANTLENGIVLCPNCHRLAHIGRLSRADLNAIRADAVPLNPAV